MHDHEFRFCYKRPNYTTPSEFKVTFLGRNGLTIEYVLSADNSDKATFAAAKKLHEDIKNVAYITHASTVRVS